MLVLSKELFFVVAVDKIIVNVINNPTTGRASPRRNYNDQHPLAERPKCATTGVTEFVSAVE